MDARLSGHDEKEDFSKTVTPAKAGVHKAWQSAFYALSTP